VAIAVSASEKKDRLVLLLPLRAVIGLVEVAEVEYLG